MSLSGRSDSENNRKPLKRGSLLGKAVNQFKRASHAIGIKNARRKTKGTLQRKALKPTASFREENPSINATKSRKVAVKQANNLYANLAEKLFNSEINEKRFRDISRMGFKIQLELDDETKEESETYIPRDHIVESDFPNSAIREMRMIAEVAKKLIEWFGRANEPLARIMSTYMTYLCEMFEKGQFEEKYTLENLFAKLEEKMCTTPIQEEIVAQTKQVLKFVTVSVIIFALMEMRDRLTLGPKHLTKDLHWDVFVRLSDRVVEVKHERVERTMEEKQNYWELGYMVILTFSPDMTQFITARMKITDLDCQEENFDPEFWVELKEKFCNGQLIVC